MGYIISEQMGNEYSIDNMYINSDPLFLYIFCWENTKDLKKKYEIGTEKVRIFEKT